MNKGNQKPTPTKKTAKKPTVASLQKQLKAVELQLKNNKDDLKEAYKTISKDCLLTRKLEAELEEANETIEELKLLCSTGDESFARLQEENEQLKKRNKAITEERNTFDNACGNWEFVYKQKVLAAKGKDDDWALKLARLEERNKNQQLIIDKYSAGKLLFEKQEAEIEAETYKNQFGKFQEQVSELKRDNARLTKENETLKQFAPKCEAAGPFLHGKMFIENGFLNNPEEELKSSNLRFTGKAFNAFAFLNKKTKEELQNEELQNAYKYLENKNEKLKATVKHLQSIKAPIKEAHYYEQILAAIEERLQEDLNTIEADMYSLKAAFTMLFNHEESDWENKDLIISNIKDAYKVVMTGIFKLIEITEPEEEE